MRVEKEGNLDIVVLSRRNLLALLAKLDGSPPDSACSIFLTVPPLLVKAEEDEVHYAHPSREGAPPGFMHSDTEAKLQA